MSIRQATLTTLFATALIAGTVGAFLVPVPAFAAAATEPTDQPMPLPDLLPTLQPAVVAITVLSHITPTPPPGQPSLWRERGSGFIVTKDGMLGTARHVVANGFDFTVTLLDGTQLKADLVFEASTLDVAVLKIRGDGPFPTVKMGDSNTVRVGDPVFTIGNPLGLQQTVTHGIISALDRDLGDTRYDNYMQTDAPINPGNSGGPLFNAEGEVIGMNMEIYTRGGGGSIGLGFVLPINDAHWTVMQWRRNHDARPSWIGAAMQPLSPDLATALGYPKQLGVVVAATAPGGPAAEAKLQSGDVVLKFGDGGPMNARSFQRSVAMSEPGKAVPMEIWRDNKVMTVQVTPRPWPDYMMVAVPPMSAQDLGVAVSANLGIDLAPLDKAARGKLKLAPNQQGVPITSVAPSTDASLKGVTAGSAILAADDQPVTSVAAFREHVKSARQQKHPFLLLQTNDGNNISLVALRLGS